MPSKGDGAAPPALRCVTLALCVVSTGCDGPQSALDPAGIAALRLADLFYVLTLGAALIWGATVGLALYATYARRVPVSQRVGVRLVVVAGVIVPTVLLAGTLAYALALLPPLLPESDHGARRIEVIGEQWWWRVRYFLPNGTEIELANEIRLAAGEPVLLELASDDVIHSFWIPALGGKADMIPGRQIQLKLEPTEPGVYRGVCAEYSGTSHASMAFRAVVLPRSEFDAWLSGQSAPAVAPASALAAAGAEAFLRHGCSACHAIRGTPARGGVGPDLTHVGSRLSLAAGSLGNDPNAFMRWISRPDEIKPGVHMPAFAMLPAEDLAALAAYLESLQ